MSPFDPDGGAVPHEPVDVGSAGASARAEYQRRHTARQARIEHTWGPLAGIVKAVSPDPRSTTAWRSGASGEEQVAVELARRVRGRALFLYDRRVPGTRGNIDIVAVAPSGVWVIDVKRYSGMVERRDVGGVFRSDVRLYVGGRDRSGAVAGMGWQVAAVANALGACAFRGLPAPEVHAVLCFTGAQWRLLARPFVQDGVHVLWTRKLAELLCVPGPLDRGQVQRLHETLAGALPSKR
ncbi:MAG: nuclease-related domain-containing protein [Acidimicrobiales bacterium]